MVYMEFHHGSVSPYAASAEIQDMLNSFYMDFNDNVYAYPINGFVG